MSEGRQTAPETVWEAVRADYLDGMSGPECCRRHGVGLSALRARASRESWRRIDQPWMPPTRLDPYDEGLEPEEAIGGDINRIQFGDLPHVARSRVTRAVLRDDPLAAMRWRRLERMLQHDDDELKRWVEEERFRVARLCRAEERAAEVEALAREAELLEDAVDASDDSSDAVDSVDGVHASDASDGVFYDSDDD